MVRGKTALIVRLLCSFALVLAALPIRASGMACAEPVPQPAAAAKASCEMACCQPVSASRAIECRLDAKAKASAKSACCTLPKAVVHRHSAPHGHSLGTNDRCQCELTTAPGVPPSVDKTVPQGGFDHPVFAILPPPRWGVSLEVGLAEPGIFGVDSGPPPSEDLLPDSGRSPPVARA